MSATRSDVGVFVPALMLALVAPAQAFHPMAGHADPQIGQRARTQDLDLVGFLPAAGATHDEILDRWRDLSVHFDEVHRELSNLRRIFAEIVSGSEKGAPGCGYARSALPR